MMGSTTTVSTLSPRRIEIERWEVRKMRIEEEARGGGEFVQKMFVM